MEKAKIIKKFEDIDELKEINGIAIKEIERRARPLKKDPVKDDFIYDRVRILFVLLEIHNNLLGRVSCDPRRRRLRYSSQSTQI